MSTLTIPTNRQLSRIIQSFGQIKPGRDPETPPSATRKLDERSLRRIIELLRSRRPQPVDTLVTHAHVDLDAALALYLPSRFGKELFPGAEKANIELYSQEPMPKGLPPKHRLAGDVWEGLFDHHPHGVCPGLCASDLMAIYLGVYDRRPLEKLLGFVRHHDLQGPTKLSRTLRGFNIPEEICPREYWQEICRQAAYLESLSIAGMISRKRAELGDDDLRLIEWMWQEFDGLYARQLRFWTIVKEEFLKKAEITDQRFGGRNYRIATISTNVREVGSFSRTREGNSCTVCIHRYPRTGHTFITGSLRPDEWREIAKPLRVWEMQERQITQLYTHQELIFSRMEINSTWYLPANGEDEPYMIMNGGEKAFKIEPSVLPVATTKEAVLTGLAVANYGKEVLPPEYCPLDYCRGRTCEFFPFLFTPCRKIRGFDS